MRISRTLPLTLAVCALALVLRASNAPIPPLDDLYHLKRFAAFPHLLDPDPDRGLGGAFCPWPPLYDFAAGAAARVVGTKWLAPLGFTLFLAAWCLRGEGLVALVLAVSPYLVGVSRANALDHHWTEPALMLLIVRAVTKRRPLLLAAALTAAMSVQTAFLVAAAVAFVVAFVDEMPHAERSFAAAALAIALCRLTRPDGYPDSAWFLGWVHVAAFTAAALALALRARGLHRIGALAAGALALLPVAPLLVRGTHFFGGDPWLSTISEFQPMFRDPASVGTDVANLTGGVLLAFVIVRRHRGVAIFAIAYTLLALSSRRFLVPGIPLFALAGALAVAEARGPLRRAAFVALLLVPPVAYDVWDALHPTPPDSSLYAIAARIRELPPGRVLAPWWMGHAIDVAGRHPVVIDNFGSMPDDALWLRANEALRTRDVAWCRAHGVRYLVDARGGVTVIR